MGDHVEITCRSIEPVWEEETAQYQSIELAKLRFVRGPLPGELSEILTLPRWRAGVNLLTRPGATSAGSAVKWPEQTNAAIESDPVAHRNLEHARDINLEYASHMPNFVADETAKRYTSIRASTKWRFSWIRSRRRLPSRGGHAAH